MTKVVTKKLLDYQEQQVLQPLRNKLDYAKLLMHASRILLLDYEEPVQNSACLLKLVIDKMSRIFIFHDGKFFSVGFPFTVIFEKNKISEIQTHSKQSVDNAAISGVISIINSSLFQLNPSLLEHWNRLEDHELLGLSLLEEIFALEPAYIRYDHDPDRSNGKIHPLYHLDINYSGYGTFKVGLKKKMSKNSFEDILNISTDCCFLE